MSEVSSAGAAEMVHHYLYMKDSSGDRILLVLRLGSGSALQTSCGWGTGFSQRQPGKGEKTKPNGRCWNRVQEVEFLNSTRDFSLCKYLRGGSVVPLSSRIDCGRNSRRIGQDIALQGPEFSHVFILDGEMTPRTRHSVQGNDEATRGTFSFAALFLQCMIRRTGVYHP